MSELPHFFCGTLCLLERMNDIQLMGYTVFGIWQTFSRQQNKVSLSLQRKQLTVFVADYKIWASKKEHQNFGKIVPATMILKASQYLTIFSDKVVVICIWLFDTVNKMCQHLEDLCNSVNPVGITQCYRIIHG